MSASNQSQDQELFYPTTAGNPMQPAPATDQAWQQQSAANEQTPAYMQHMTLVLVILHLSVFISGLVGNSLVCLSVYRNKSLQTVTNYYIVNLAVADFLVILICLPPTVYWDLTLTWNFGLIPCKLVLYLQSISVSVSVLTLTCISIDRWYAICRPLEFCSTKSRAKVTIVLIWLLSMLIASPDVIFLTTKPIYEEDDHVYMDCTYSWPESNTSVYQLCIVTLLFVFPFVLMSISYWHIVNVLWRNETMAESCQNSFKQQADTSLGRRPTTEPSVDHTALSECEPEADQVKSPDTTNRALSKPEESAALPAPQAASSGATAVVVCLLVVDERPLQAAAGQGTAAASAATAAADGRVGSDGDPAACVPDGELHGLGANSCVNDHNQPAKESSRLHLSSDQAQGIADKRPARFAAIGKSLIAAESKQQDCAPTENSAPLCGSNCLARLVSCKGDKFMAQKTSKRYRKNLANYAARKAKFMTSSQGLGESSLKASASTSAPDQRPTSYRLARIANQVARGPSHANKGAADSQQPAAFDKKAWLAYRQPKAQTSPSEPDNSGPSSPEVAGKGQSEADEAARSTAPIGASCWWRKPGATSKTGRLIGAQSQAGAVASRVPSGAANPSINNNATRFCKLIESRKKAAKMLIVIVIMFGLCYLPIHFLNTLRYTIGLPQNHITTIASLVSHWLCYFNSAINPLIYNLMSVMKNKR